MIQASTLIKTSTKCPACKLQIPVCMCGEIPTLETRTKVVLLVHAVEAKKPTNTGILATQCLKLGEYHIRGRDDRIPIPYEKFLDDPERTPLILFPEENAAVLTPEYVAKIDRPVTLIVPDGNWSQAKKMPKREKPLAGIPRVVLPIGELSEYKLRREPLRKPHGLATMEAIARALFLLEGNLETYDTLLRVFHTKINRCLWARGTIGVDELLSREEQHAANRLAQIKSALHP